MTKRPLRPKFLWNNAYLEKLATELGDECIFLCLSPVSFRMLTDMTKMLLWATRYEDREVPELGKTAYRELNVPCLEDFYSRLDELNNTDWLQGQFDALGSRMTELEQMDINVTQTVSGGCCSCDGETSSTATNTVDGITIDPEDTGIIPPYMTEIIEVADGARCRAANFIAVKIIAMIRAMENLGDTAGAVVLVILGITTIVTLLSPILGDEVISATAFMLWAIKLITLRRASGYISNYFADIANGLQDNIEEFTCALYDWETAEELGAIIESWSNAKIDQMAFDHTVPESTVTLYKDFINSVMGSEVVNWLVDNIAHLVPADFVPQYDCICGATGDSCPTQNIVLAGIGGLIDGDLTGTTQGFGSTFNGQTGFYEIILEFAANYCVTIDNATYTPIEEHEKCSSGVMVSSDGSCIRRFVARSQAPFGTAVTFDSQTEDCSCLPSDVYVWLVGTAEGRDCPTDAHVFDSCEVDHFDSYGGRVSFYRILGVTPFTGNGLWIEADIPAGSSIELQVDNGLGLFENGLTKETAVSSGVTYFDFSSAVNFGGNSDSIPESFDVECKHIGNPEHPLIRSWGIY